MDSYGTRVSPNCYTSRPQNGGREEGRKGGRVPSALDRLKQRYSKGAKAWKKFEDQFDQATENKRGTDDVIAGRNNEEHARDAMVAVENAGEVGVGYAQDAGQVALDVEGAGSTGSLIREGAELGIKQGSKGALDDAGRIGGRQGDELVDPATRNGWRAGANDLDFRGTGKGTGDALETAFERTGVPRDEFEVTRWAKDANGKSVPVEWRSKGGAEVNIDIGHTTNGPAVPHVGYQTPGKRSSDGGKRGHILLDDVNANRSPNRQ